MAKQSLAYLFFLRSTSFDLTTTTTNDVAAFGVENDEGMCWEW